MSRPDYDRQIPSNSQNRVDYDMILSLAYSRTELTSFATSGQSNLPQTERTDRSARNTNVAVRLAIKPYPHFRTISAFLVTVDILSQTLKPTNPSSKSDGAKAQKPY